LPGQHFASPPAELERRDAVDYWRFEKFMKHAKLMLNTFQQFRTMCEKAIEDEKRAKAAPLGSVGRPVTVARVRALALALCGD
jgi:hypothetical protein